MKPWVLIGCPVYKREWILPHWFEAITKQDYGLENIGFVFLVAPHGDQGTIDLIVEFAAQHPQLKCCDIVPDTSPDHLTHVESGDSRRRNWNQHRYTRMTDFRNRLLDQVIAHDPDRYFSLDSDILLEDPTSISQLVEITETRSAAAPLCFMVPPGVDGSTSFPNFMEWANTPGGAAYRPLTAYGELRQADVIMASVMMNRNAYQNSRYQYHRQGEDLGWSADCAAKGLDLWSASHIYASHVMYREELADYLEYGDKRGDLAIH